MKNTSALSLLIFCSLTLSAVTLAQTAKTKGSKFNVDCSLKADPSDLIAQNKDVIVGGTENIKDVIVTNGNITVLKGAKVETVLVSNGNITIEEGATVKGSVLAVGGKVKVSKKTDVKESIIWVDDGIHVLGNESESFDLNLNINGSHWAN
jgi:predicted acyltransferase (DUF342 family)